MSALQTENQNLGYYIFLFYFFCIVIYKTGPIRNVPTRTRLGFLNHFFSPNIVYELKRIIVSSILHAAFHWKVMFIAFKFIYHSILSWSVKYCKNRLNYLKYIDVIQACKELECKSIAIFIFRMRILTAEQRSHFSYS